MPRKNVMAIVGGFLAADKDHRGSVSFTTHPDGLCISVIDPAGHSCIIVTHEEARELAGFITQYYTKETQS